MLFEQLTEVEAREISKQDGFEIGRKEGREEGRAEGKIEVLFDLLGELDLRLRIVAQRDLTVLGSWIKLAAKAGSIEDFEKEIS